MLPLSGCGRSPRISQSHLSEPEGAGGKRQTLCAYHLQGFCNKGDKCKYSHDLSDVPEEVRRRFEIEPTGTERSEGFEKSKDELPGAPQKERKGKGKGKGKGKKKEPCLFFFENGTCRHGEKCYLSHDPADKPAGANAEVGEGEGEDLPQDSPDNNKAKAKPKAKRRPAGVCVPRFNVPAAVCIPRPGLVLRACGAGGLGCRESP